MIRSLKLLLLGVTLASCVDPPSAPNAMRLPDAASGESPMRPALDTLGLIGAFNGLAGHEAGGTVSIEYRSGNIAVITLGADFRASRVPDPHLYLNTEGSPNRGTPIRFARLDAFSGTQRYVVQLPANAPAYTHLLLWCDRYNQGVGSARLSR